PNLVVKDSWPPFRTQVSLVSLLALYVWFGAFGIWLVLRDWLRPRVTAPALKAAEWGVLTLAVAVVGTSVLHAANNVTTLIAEPQMTELRLLRGQVSQLPAGTPTIGFVETDWFGGMTNRVAYDEFGLPSSARPWALEPSVDLILREEGRLSTKGPFPVIQAYSPATTSFPPGEPVIDLRSLQQLR